MKTYVELDAVLALIGDDREVCADPKAELKYIRKDIEALPTKIVRDKYKPPKRLPCVCGRKQLDIWWSAEIGNKGPFLKCPNCGRTSPASEKQIKLNETWNKMIEEETNDQQRKEEHG